jgi:hypothetical protein
MEDTIIPASEAAKDLHVVYPYIPINNPHLDWTQILDSYDRAYSIQVDSVKDRMQQYDFQSIY